MKILITLAILRVILFFSPRDVQLFSRNSYSPKDQWQRISGFSEPRSYRSGKSIGWCGCFSNHQYDEKSVRPIPL